MHVPVHATEQKHEEQDERLLQVQDSTHLLTPGKGTEQQKQAECLRQNIGVAQAAVDDEQNVLKWQLQTPHHLCQQQHFGQWPSQLAECMFLLGHSEGHDSPTHLVGLHPQVSFIPQVSILPQVHFLQQVGFSSTGKFSSTGPQDSSTSAASTAGN